MALLPLSSQAQSEATPQGQVHASPQHGAGTPPQEQAGPPPQAEENDPATTQEEETAQEATQEPEPPKRRIYWDEGLWIETLRVDSRHKIGGAVQLDSAAFLTYPSLEDLTGEVGNGVEWRRARVYARGTLGVRWGYLFRWDFAVNDPPNLKDAFLEFKFVRLPIRLRGGRFGSTFGLENQGSNNDTVFMEAGLPAAFVPPQETGVLVHSDAPRARWDVSFAGATSSLTECILCDVTGVAARYGRAFELGGPERLLHVGGDLAWRWVRDDVVQVAAQPESNLAPVLVDTGPLLGDRTTTAMAEVAILNGPFSLQSEYGLKRVRVPGGEDPLFHAFYVMAAYSITGEMRNYDHARGIIRRIRPNSEFRDGSGGRGAFEVAARFSRIDLNDKDILGGILNDLGLAVNWYPTHLTRVMGNVIMAKRDGAAAMWIFQVRLQLAL